MKAIENRVRVAPLKLTGDGPSELKASLEQLHSDVEQLGVAHNKNDEQLVTALRSDVRSDRVRYRDVTVDMPPDAPWLDVTFGGSWSNLFGYQSAQYLMEPGGRASTRGMVTIGNQVTVTQLPAGYGGPAEQYVGLVHADGTVLSVTSAGAIKLLDPGSAWAGNYPIQATWLATPKTSGAIANPHSFPSPWPVLVSHPWNKCLGLDVVGCIEATANARGLTGAAVVDWEDVGGGQLRLNAVWGLQWGKRYTIRLRLNAEE